MKTNKGIVLRDSLLLIIILIISTIIGKIFSSFDFHETNIVIFYLFSVLLVARFTKGYLYGILASIISLLLFNWFFTEPYFTFKVNDMTYLITFAIMMLTSVFTSAITTKAKQSTEEAREREKESNALYQMTNHLTDAECSENIAKVIVNAVGDALDCKTSFICFDENSLPEKRFIQRMEDDTLIHRELDNPEELKQIIALQHNGVAITNDDHFYPIYGNDDILAVLQIPVTVGDTMTDSQTRMLHSIIESASLALERMRSLQAQAKSREETIQERYRGNLLRAISHDIRTPLSGIMGTSEILMRATDKEDYSFELANNIYNDALWLHNMVENILNLTKLQDGKLILDKQPEAVEEVIGATLRTMEKRLPCRSIEVLMPDNVVMVPMDAKLISQVLINLLDNANKHTPVEKEINLTVTKDEKDVIITVADQGNGISDEDLPHIFKMFYTTGNKRPDSKRGVGLGLAICQSIVEAHGGKISAYNRQEGGAAFTFTLPLESEEV